MAKPVDAPHSGHETGERGLMGSVRNSLTNELIFPVVSAVVLDEEVMQSSTEQESPHSPADTEPEADREFCYGDVEGIYDILQLLWENREVLHSCIRRAYLTVSAPNHLWKVLDSQPTSL